ncbi:hypothetical protein MTR_4g101440 [Medicago truncatula]|uniref:Uncharacterized protein n=1 Tax=Medicago truncatula TaxID=3880 RepID=A0A072V0J0_MEDTR|nr:hypothetical protein MTR_4g101440 [Medicago truncatula]
MESNECSLEKLPCCNDADGHYHGENYENKAIESAEVLLTTPKRFGGRGIREIRLTNFAMLGKLVWNMLHNKDKLWVKDVWEDGRWNLQGLATMIPVDIVQYIHQLPAPNNLDVRLPNA